MKKKFTQASALWLIAGSALVLLILFFISGAVGFAVHKIAVKNDYTELSPEEFTLSGIEVLGDGCYYTTDGDPQMIKDIDTRVCSIKFYAEYSVHPGEILAYYTQKEGQGFSPKKRLIFKPIDKENGWYEATCAPKHIKSLRIDPTMLQDSTINMGKIIINEEKSLSDFIALGYGDLYHLVIYTGILSSCLKMIQLLLKRDLK